MSKNNPVPTEQSNTNLQLIAAPDETPVVLQDVLRELGIAGPRIPADQLKGKTFTIVRAKPFMSSFAEDKQAYFCVIVLEGDSTPYTTVLGGQAVVDVIQAYILSGGNKPLTVTLDFIEQGRWAGYYQLS